MPLAKSIVTLQMITLALLIGVINIAAIMVAITMFSGDVKLSTDLDVLTMVVILFAIIVVIAAMIVPRMVLRQAAPFAAQAAQERDDSSSPVVDPSKPMSPSEKQMFGVYQTSHIIKAALLEGRGHGDDHLRYEHEHPMHRDCGCLDPTPRVYISDFRKGGRLDGGNDSSWRA
ncbi:MAG: hypothetical protein R3C05_31355 [Pirellulaceae bacterium]